MTLPKWSPMVATVATLAFTSAVPAQSVTEIPAPTVATSAIDMDLVGPVGPTTLAAINAAANPAGGVINNITLNPSGAAAGVYNTNPTRGRALGLDPSGVGLALMDPPSGAFAAFNAQIDLPPCTEFGVGIGDWVGPMILDFYSGGTLILSYTSTTYNTADPKYFQFTPGGGFTTFDRVDIQASTTAGNWVITDLEIQITSGLFPEFTASPRSGTSPLTVNFTDQTYTSGQIIQWLWDIDNDGTVDYFTQNPTHTYTAGGVYSVTLTIIDQVHGQASITKNGYIEVDLPHANFTFQVGGCNSVQFTDTSTGPVTGWAWDFDNDGTIDSTAQNPNHTYPAAGTYQCNLAVTNPFGSDSITKEVSVNVGSLTTLFAANNGGSVGGIVYFDLTVNNAISVTGVETNYDVSVGSPVGIQMYTVPGGWSGNETNPGAWTLVAQDNGLATSAGLDQPTQITFASPASLSPGTYGVGLVAIGDGHRYTNGNGSNQTYSNGDMTIQLGAAQNTPFTGSPFNPRVWNGSILYGLTASAVDYGTGTDSGLNNGAPTMTTSALPLLGQTAQLSITQFDPNASGFALIGSGQGPLPTPFGQLNMGSIWVAIPVAAPMPVGTPQLFNFNIPNQCSLSGNSANWVNINLVVGSPNGLSLSNGTEWTVR